jgi:type I restriction enzyme S subunit
VVHALNSSLYAAQVLQKAAGTTRQRISRGNLGRLAFPLPPIGEQDRIVAKVDELMAVCGELEGALASVRFEREQLLKSLLHASLNEVRGPMASTETVVLDN